MKTFTIKKLHPNEILSTLWKEESCLHCHSDWEFTTSTNGSGENYINGVTYPSLYGTFTLLGPQHIHKNSSKTPISRRDIWLSCDMLRAICDNLDKTLYESLYAINTPINIPLPLSVFNDIIDRLAKLDTVSPSLDNEKIQVLKSIVAFLLGIYIENRAFSKSIIPSNITEFIIKLHNPEVFTNHINDIIALSNYSHSHFLNLFKRYTNLTLINYVTNLRLEYAAKLLLTTDMSVITVSTSVGYDNQSFFTSKFKEKYKMTPLEFRKQKS